MKIMGYISEYFSGYQFVYIFLFGGFVFLSLAAFVKSKKIKLVCLALFSVLVTMAFAEFILALKIKSKGTFENYPKRAFSLRDNIVYDKRQMHVIDKNGIKIKCPGRSTAAGEKIIYDCIVSRYCNGFRYTKCNLNSDKNYIFLGCSFTFGEGLSNDMTLPHYFSGLADFKNNVLNCGLEGRSTNSAISVMNSGIISRFVNKNSKTEYVVYSLISDHIARNFRTFTSGSSPGDNHMFKEGKWIRAAQPFGIFKIIFAKSYIFNTIFLQHIDKYNESYYEDYMIDSLKKLNEITKTKYNGKLIVMVWPDLNKITRFMNKLKNTDLDLIFIPKYFEDDEYKIAEDGHPNGKANLEIAKILMAHIESKDNKINTK